MITYQVRLEAQPTRADELVRYMTRIHIPAIMRTGCFRSARFERLDTAAGAFRTCYVAATRGDLERYLRDHAASFREEFVRDMGDAATASREVWESVQGYGDVIY
jgi:hypothetical protein